MSTPCPTCGTHFESGTEPWTLQKVTCPKHDFTHAANVECDHCVSEALNAIANEND